MKKLFGILTLLVLLLAFGFVFGADTNGIWHRAEDVGGGIFGKDEQPIANYTFINPVYFEDNAYVDGNKVAFLDSTDKVPLENLPFHKGDLLSPEDRPLVSGLSSYYISYFNISNLGISGVEASNVREGVTFGPDNQLVGSLSDDVICTSAGGNANCGATSTVQPGSFYTKVGTNSVTGTNYCTRIDIGSDGSVTSTNVITAGICTYVSNCDASSQTGSFYASGTACGGGKVCMFGGSCISPVTSYYNPGTYTYTVPAGITSLKITAAGGGGGGGRAADAIGSGQAGTAGGTTTVNGIVRSYGGQGGESYDIGSEPEYGGSNGGARGSYVHYSGTLLSSNSGATRGSHGSYEGGNGKGGSNAKNSAAALETSGGNCGGGGGADYTSGYRAGGGGASRVITVLKPVSGGQTITFTVGGRGGRGGSAGYGGKGCVIFEIVG